MVSDRDFALLQEELKCLRKRLSSKVSTAGGYSTSLLSPGSSVYPNDYLDNCQCQTEYSKKDDDLDCDSTNLNPAGLGDLEQPGSAYGESLGLFVFDAIQGVLYKPHDTNLYENRNIGLTSSELEHGTLDPWWYKKTEKNEDNAILWRCGLANVKRSANAGRQSWIDVTPALVLPISNLRFIQIHADQFQENWFYALAQSESTPYRTYLFRTKNDGQDWDYVDLTTYNDITERVPIWLVASSYLWVCTWGNNKLRLLKVTNDPTMEVSTEYDFGDASYFEMENKYATISVECALDSDDIYVYGRFTHPTLGLAHIVTSANEGLSWTVIENTWELDWCGSFRTSISENGSRTYYGVRNYR